MIGTAFYNEIAPHKAEWIGNLIAGELVPLGPVLTRSIKELTADELRPHTQVHFFAGVAGWPVALRLAGWPEDRPVWSGSCPCQPFSSTGRGEGQADPRHLWPDMFRLIRECGPHVVFGEQVASAIGHGWLDGISADLEREGYAVGATVLGAHSVGSPHRRQRLYWVAKRTGVRWIEGQQCRSAGKRNEPGRGGIGNGSGLCSVHYATQNGRGQERADDGRSVAGSGTQGGIERPWGNFDVVTCRDRKARRIESGLKPLAHGVSGRVAVRRPGQRPDAPDEEHWYNRAAALEGFGDAIVPQVAAEFISVFMEDEREHEEEIEAAGI